MIFDREDLLNKTKGYANQAKDYVSQVREKSLEIDSDETLADLVMLAAQKQEGINQILQERGSNYRVADIDIEMGLPPKVVLGIRRIGDQTTEPNRTGAQTDQLETFPDSAVSLSVQE